jgi:hypothetical protein
LLRSLALGLLLVVLVEQPLEYLQPLEFLD